MLYLTQILPAIGYAFLHSFWQMGLLLVIYCFIAKLVKSSAAIRFRIATLLSLGGVFLFIITFFVGIQQPQNFDIAESTGIIPNYWYHYTMLSAGAFYFVLLSWRLAQLFTQYKNLQQLHELPFTKAPVQFRIFVEKHAAYLGIHRSIQLRLQHIISPATFGFIKPIILLPVTCITQLTSMQVEALLLHELAHIKRNDFVWSLILQIAESILCVNPFMQQLVQMARQESEHACDDYVLQFGYQPNEYAKALLVIAKNQTAPAWAVGAKGQMGGEHLLHRITRMLTGGDFSFYRNLKTTSLSLLLATGFVAWLLPMVIQQPSKKSSYSLLEISEPAIEGKLVQTKPTTWNGMFLEAKTSIFASAVGKASQVTKGSSPEGSIEIRTELDLHEVLVHGQRQHLSTIDNIMEEELASKSKVMISPINAEKQDDQLAEMHGNTLILSAGWVNTLQENPEQIDEKVTKGLQEISELLEKLETEKELADVEWQQLIALISVHTSIKNKLYQQAYLQQNPQIAAFNAYEVQEDKEGVLVIIYDEATSVLGITVMQPVELPEHIVLNTNIKADEQQVVFIRRNLIQKGKTIQL